MQVNTSQIAKVLRIIGAVAAVVTGAIDPSHALSNNAQTILVSAGSIILASEHLISGAKEIITHRLAATVKSLENMPTGKGN